MLAIQCACPTSHSSCLPLLPATLPLPQVRYIISLLAPVGLWQEGRAAAHPDILPVQLHSRAAFRQLVRGTAKACGQALPPRSRLSVEEVTPRQVRVSEGFPIHMGAALMGTPSPAKHNVAKPASCCSTPVLQAPPPQEAEQWPRSPLAALNRMMHGLFGQAQ